MTRRATTVTSTVTFERDGAQHGHLRLPASRDDSAWGVIMIPISVLRNGAGPTALLTGANHGDEYEGPIALQSLAWELDPRRIQGRVIIVPYMNTPAFHAGRRTSPLDGINLNRCFPGRPDGSPTERIADFFLRELVPMADIVLDYHSGGKSLDFIPFAAAHRLEDKAQEDACIAAMKAFGAPYSMTLKEIDPVGMYDTAVEDAGKIFVSTELGGGGTATRRSVAIARRGADNILKHAAILDGDPEIGPSRMIDTTTGNCFHFAEEAGLVEPLIDLGEMVEDGQPVARIWPVDRSGQPPEIARSMHSGILAARHFPGLVKSGDCLAVVATVLDE